MMSKLKSILKGQYESETIMNKTHVNKGISKDACVTNSELITLEELTRKNEDDACEVQMNISKRKSEHDKLGISSVRANLLLNNSFIPTHFMAEGALQQDNNFSEDSSKHGILSQEDSSENSKVSAALSPSTPVDVSEVCAASQENNTSDSQIATSANVRVMHMEDSNVTLQVNNPPTSILPSTHTPTIVSTSTAVVGGMIVVEVPPVDKRYFENIGKTNEPVSQVSSVSSASQESGDSRALPDRQPQSISTAHRSKTNKEYKYGKVELYAPDTGPKLYDVKGNIISRPIITKNLPEAFMPLPVHGKSESKACLEDFYRQKIRDYVGYGINDTEFEKLEEFCSPEYLKTGDELAVSHSFPSQGTLPADLKTVPAEKGSGENLCILKKYELRKLKDKHNHYPRKLKYRGLRLLPLAHEDDDQSSVANDDNPEDNLEPGRDLIFRVRMYRPYSYGNRDAKPNRHSVFNNDIVLLGRQKLTVLRDRMGCPNDIGMRVDVSENPDVFCTDSAKLLFPSGFLFINNVFYVDRRAGCQDHSAGIREWARRRRLGDFPVRDLAAVRLDQMPLRLGHPEVYVHQGKCEHVFTFSDVRLVGPGDPLRASRYPSHTAIAQNQSVYCTTCAEFSAKWIVVGCSRVPFDPAFFCETCFKLYLYDRDGNKIGNFKAYSYRGNTVNFLKPVSGCPEVAGTSKTLMDFETG